MYFLLSNQTKHISETALVTSTYIFCCWPCYLLANEKLFIDTHTAQKTPVHLIFVEYDIILLSNARNKKRVRFAIIYEIFNTKSCPFSQHCLITIHNPYDLV